MINLQIVHYLLVEKRSSDPFVPCLGRLQEKFPYPVDVVLAATAKEKNGDLHVFVIEKMVYLNQHYFWIWWLKTFSYMYCQNLHTAYTSLSQWLLLKYYRFMRHVKCFICGWRWYRTNILQEQMKTKGYIKFFLGMIALLDLIQAIQLSMSEITKAERVINFVNFFHIFCEIDFA